MRREDASVDEGEEERRNRRRDVNALQGPATDFFAGLIAVDVRLFRH